MAVDIINYLTTYSIELVSIIVVIVGGLGLKYMHPLSRKRAATTQHTESLTEGISKDFVNLTVQTAEINDSKLFFSSGAKKPKFDNDTKTPNNTPKAPNNELRDIELEMQIIAQQSQEADRVANEDSEDKKQFWEEFSNIITDTKTKSNISADITFSVWVSWSSIASGQMQLSNEVFTLQHKWGTIDAMNELKKLINEREIINSWALLSVFPIK